MDDFTQQSLSSEAFSVNNSPATQPEAPIDFNIPTPEHSFNDWSINKLEEKEGVGKYREKEGGGGCSREFGRVWVKWRDVGWVGCW